ncbi:maleylpyruvate isomerase family mycothiol-dependent enzyme [Myceligenerans xiligouense]|uniref:Maleylpyruvate isomerase n=1 Tax=Myceligenerans xiligouense TaxID=253184 RepID=A0A3N4YTH2_9MICO|nr:maleylpyruvate isomerase family mycothiol-dependent enzyme [Myceligenerans xiligouense]RPF21880.1 maleylpyruvate isomerase [Myceligenerans xiligouense]
MPARTDRTTDPELRAGLLLARRGQAYFSRKLNELPGDRLDEPSLVAGWTRRHVVAHVGLNARALTRLTAWAATGVETPMYRSPEERDAEIEFAATLPARALRNLCAHGAVHLDVEWRDLPEEAWRAPVRTALGRVVPASETVWMRTREVWVHAVDLDSGGTFADFPPELLDALLADVAGAWRRRLGPAELPRLVLEPTDRDHAVPIDGSAHMGRNGVVGVGWESISDEHVDTVTLRGTAAELARWATGRGAGGVVASGGGAVPAPPRWL